MRSCYWLIRDHIASQASAARGSGDGVGDPAWKEIWSLDVPPKLRVFLWRACRNILPTMVELFKRRVSTNPKCPACGVEPETIHHTLMVCRWLNYLWRDDPFSLSPIASNATMWSILAHFKAHISRDNFVLGLVLCWKAWTVRND